MKQFNRELLSKFTYTMRVKKYSQNTIDNYQSMLKLFFDYTKKQSKDISINDFHCYLLYLHDNTKLSFSYHSQIVSAWKLYLELIHHKKLKYDYRYQPRKTKSMIEVLSVAEVWKLINCINHVKQKAIITGIYLHGLRRSEILNIKYSDVLKDEKLLMIKGAKGNKDRKVPLNKEWLKYLANYAKSEGHKKGYDKPIFYPYSESSIYQIVKRKAKEAGISKRVYPHLLRDCYASHLLHQGIDPIFIQEILGHEKLETTRKYIHISAVNISEIALKIA